MLRPKKGFGLLALDSVRRVRARMGFSPVCRFWWLD
jgi:hypothetical protein